MPTYDYECASCGHTFEVFQKITDNSLEKCPKCNEKVRRLISGGAGIIFKGSGFYATDYRKDAKKEKSNAPANVCPKIKEGCDGCKPLQ